MKDGERLDKYRRFRDTFEIKSGTVRTWENQMDGGHMAGPKRGDTGTAEIATIMAAASSRPPGRGRGVRSGIFLWLAQRYEKLVVGLSPPAAPYWEGIAEALRERFPDVLDGDGKPPTGERVRKAWHAVRAQKRAEAAGQPRSQRRRRGDGKAPAPLAPVLEPVMAPATVPVVGQPTPLAAAPEDDDDTDGVLQFAKGRK